jgi:hypothetical protein
MKQERFTKEFEEEAVRLLRTSGRSLRRVVDTDTVGLPQPRPGDG